ncbi:MAG: roadblock/LC7 domain-containing protein [Ilumatobacteraceae bacterium]
MSSRYPTVATEIIGSMRHLLDQLVAGSPGVIGALVASVDGFALASNVPVGLPSTDAAGLAAMSAAALGVSNRLVGAVGREPAREVTLRSPSGQVMVYRIANVAALTVLTDASVDVERLHAVSREVANGIERLLRGAASLAAPRT